jgi:hypothetical protein
MYFMTVEATKQKGRYLQFEKLHNKQAAMFSQCLPCSFTAKQRFPLPPRIYRFTCNVCLLQPKMFQFLRKRLFLESFLKQLNKDYF